MARSNEQSNQVEQATAAPGEKRGEARIQGEVFVARESFSCELAGVPVSVAKGERVREGHELLRIYPGSFENVREGRVEYEA